MPVLRRVSHGPSESHPRSMISSLEVQAESAPRREIDDPGSAEEWEWDVGGE